MNGAAHPWGRATATCAGQNGTASSHDSAAASPRPSAASCLVTNAPSVIWRRSPVEFAIRMQAVCASHGRPQYSNGCDNARGCPRGVGRGAVRWLWGSCWLRGSCLPRGHPLAMGFPPAVRFPPAMGSFARRVAILAPSACFWKDAGQNTSECMPIWGRRRSRESRAPSLPGHLRRWHGAGRRAAPVFACTRWRNDQHFSESTHSAPV